MPSTTHDSQTTLLARGATGSAPSSTGTVADVDAQIKAVFARQQANRWKLANSTRAERVARLKRLKAAVIRRQDELKDALHADFRKPAAEVELTELQPVLTELNHTISHIGKWMKPTRVGTPVTLLGTSSRVRYEAKGVALILSPWNYPFNLLMCPLVAAIAAGNTVMVRPSDKVKRTSQLIKELLEEVFPVDEVAVFTGASSIANTLLALPFDHVLFTGSTRIGKQVMTSAAAHLASVTLELGGQSPVVVDESADIRLAAERIVWGKFLNSGQTCVAPNHVFVHESKAKELTECLRTVIERRYGATEEARKQTPDLARIVDQASLKRLSDVIEKSVAGGAKLELGGRSDVAERYLAPTVLSGVTDDSPVMHEELFGPVLPVLSYRDLDEVFASVHRRGKPLAMYIFSRDKASTSRMLGHTSAGGTVINNVVIHLANPNLPFGGVGESGFGNYHGPYGFRTFSHERAVLTQGWFSPLGYFYPPYGPRVRKLLQFLTKFLS